MKIKLVFSIVLFMFFCQKLVAQKVERKGGFSYDFNFGTLNDEFNRQVHSLSYYQSLNMKTQVAFRLGQAYLTETGKIGKIEKENIFFRKEVQTLIGGSFRYYVLNKKYTPMLEGRAGVGIGNETSKVNPSAGFLAGYTFRINNLKSISLGYHVEYAKYFGSTYFTDGKGESVYRVDNFYPIRKITHNVFVNFIF